MVVSMNFNLLGNSIPMNPEEHSILVTIDNKDKLFNLVQEGLTSFIQNNLHIRTHLISTSGSSNISKSVDLEQTLNLLSSQIFIDVVGQGGLPQLTQMIRLRKTVLSTSYSKSNIENYQKLNDKRQVDNLPPIYSEVVFVNGISRVIAAFPTAMKDLLAECNKLGVFVIGYDFEDNVTKQVSEKFNVKYALSSKYTIESSRK